MTVHSDVLPVTAVHFFYMLMRSEVRKLRLLSDENSIAPKPGQPIVILRS